MKCNAESEFFTKESAKPMVEQVLFFFSVFIFVGDEFQKMNNLAFGNYRN